MTRFAITPRVPRARHFGIEQAFKFLGLGPSLRELDIAADLLRKAEVEIEYNDELIELAIANGSSALTALDLVTVRYHGLWSDVGASR